jgi:ubiquinone/menaquinone biosynthesis C-methylase UbiE
MDDNQHIDRPFPETADIETSNDDYARRFAGPQGQWMLDVQEARTRELLREINADSILDVGGGHGQLAIPLAHSGYKVTVLGSDASCEKRIQSITGNGQAAFFVGDVIQLPFEDNTFDVVISFRLLTHCERWPELVSELCRTARKAVIVDYPTSQGLNAVAPVFFEAKKKLETNTRPWRLFRHSEVADAFAAQGFHTGARLGQFFMPMVLHRLLKSKALSTFIEYLCNALGLTSLWGSPVIIRMDPDHARRKPGN